MSTPETPSSGDEQPAQTEPMAANPAASVAPQPAAGPTRSRTERFQGWLGGLAPLAVGGFALLLLLVGFGAGALVVHAGQSDTKQAPFGRHGGFGPGQRNQQGQQGQRNQQGQPGQPGQRNQQGQPGQEGQPGQPGSGAFAGRFGAATAGTIVSVDGDSMTVRTAAGSTVKVTLSSSTAIRITNSGTPDDLKAGERVLVLGPNSNGTVAARSVTSGSAIAGPGGSAPTS